MAYFLQFYIKSCCIVNGKFSPRLLEMKKIKQLQFEENPK